MVRIIRGVQVASRRQAGDGRGLCRPAGAGRGIDRERPGPRHVGAEIGRDRGDIIHRLVRQVGSCRPGSSRPVPDRRCRRPESPASRTGHTFHEYRRYLPGCCCAGRTGPRRAGSAPAALHRCAGMTCIRPIAPTGEVACCSPPDSCCITARTQRSGTRIARSGLADIGTPGILRRARRRIVVRRLAPPVCTDFDPSSRAIALLRQAARRRIGNSRNIV